MKVSRASRWSSSCPLLITHEPAAERGRTQTAGPLGKGDGSLAEAGERDRPATGPSLLKAAVGVLQVEALRSDLVQALQRSQHLESEVQLVSHWLGGLPSLRSLPDHGLLPGVQNAERANRHQASALAKQTRLALLEDSLTALEQQAQSSTVQSQALQTALAELRTEYVHPSLLGT